jgi:ketosteroid isomerase-like protein
VKYPLAGISIVSLCLLAALQINARVEAQAPPDRAAVEKTIMANEIKINDAFAKKDVATMKSMIADDGAGIDMTGFAPVAELFKQLPTMDVKISESKLSDFKYQWVDPNTVIVIYTWTGKGTFMGQPVPSPVYASSVWAKRSNAWRAVFHQETPAMAVKK